MAAAAATHLDNGYSRQSNVQANAFKLRLFEFLAADYSILWVLQVVTGGALVAFNAPPVSPGIAPWNLIGLTFNLSYFACAINKIYIYCN